MFGSMGCLPNSRVRQKPFTDWLTGPTASTCSSVDCSSSGALTTVPFMYVVFAMLSLTLPNSMSRQKALSDTLCPTALSDTACSASCSTVASSFAATTVPFMYVVFAMLSTLPNSRVRQKAFADWLTPASACSATEPFTNSLEHGLRWQVRTLFVHEACVHLLLLRGHCLLLRLHALSACGIQSVLVGVDKQHDLLGGGGRLGVQGLGRLGRRGAGAQVRRTDRRLRAAALDAPAGRRGDLAQGEAGGRIGAVGERRGEEEVSSRRNRDAHRARPAEEERHGGLCWKELPNAA
eukprot:scaffold125875_cov63-Phaeocystis_antarctica.AAC.5